MGSIVINITFFSGTLRLVQVCLSPSNCSAHSSLFLSEVHNLVLKRWCNYMWKQYVPTHRALSIWLVMRPVRAMQDRKNGPPWSITGFSPFPLSRHHLFPNPFKTPLILFSPMAQQPIVGHDFHIIEVSRSHSLDTHALSRTLLDLLSTRRRDLFMTIHNNLMRQTYL